MSILMKTCIGIFLFNKNIEKINFIIIKEKGKVKIFYELFIQGYKYK